MYMSSQELPGPITGWEGGGGKIVYTVQSVRLYLHSAVNLNTKLIRNQQETVRYIKERSGA